MDGVDIRDISIETLRSQIGYVPQTGILFSGDINSNISYGAPGIDEAGIKEAAQIAQATEFIEDKPDKFESAIAQGGTNVSGGQKQRLSIARAIARNQRFTFLMTVFLHLILRQIHSLEKHLNQRLKMQQYLLLHSV